MQRQVSCSGTQTDVVTHTDLKVKTDVWSKSGEDQVIVRGETCHEGERIS